MSKKPDFDLIIIGAGVAGLAAAASISQTKKSFLCLEATGRIGGRILTIHDPMAPLPIELGAEFIHGRPPEIWDLIRTRGLTAFEHASHGVHFDRGRIIDARQVGDLAATLLSRLAKSVSRKKHGHDRSFDEYIRQSRASVEQKDWAGREIEGFNAARKERISANSLGLDERAAERIDGNRAYRLVDGYHSVPVSLLRLVAGGQSAIQWNSIVECVNWRPGLVAVDYRSALTNQAATLRCRQLLITVPLGVLQARPSSLGAIRFSPEPGEVLRAARRLEFGQVYRVNLRFRKAFWEEDERFQKVGFIFSKQKRFSTWWTTHPVFSPILTGWTAGSAADQFLDADANVITREALASLGRIMKRTIPDPESVYFHDWHNDPFFRGAYSYVPVNALPARKTMARPVHGTLFFAGEATETGGHTGTVHGAIASGLRAAASLIS